MRKRSKIPLSKESSVLFVTFSRWTNKKRLPTNGSIEPLRDFLLPKIKKLVIIDQLHPGSEGVMPRIEVFKNNSQKFKLYKSSWLVYWLYPFLKISKSEKTQIRFKLRDFLSIIDWALQDKTHYNFFIGLESINTIAGIILRRIGRVDIVIYYVSDYSPNRYPGKLFNSVYLWMDRFCAIHADYIWDVSPAMQKARISVGLDPQQSAPVVGVANGLFPDQIKKNPLSKIKRHDLVYMGTLGAENGPDIAIQSISLLKDTFKDIRLHIVGGTEKDSAWLKEIVRKLKLEEFVIFHGFIPSSTEMSKIIRECAIGLAPYKDIPGSIRKYADAGKIRAYCASGLPVVSSHVPPLGIQLEKKGGALLAHDTPKDFAKAIHKLLSDENVYEKLRNNAYLFAKNSTWDNTFSNAFRNMDSVVLKY